MRGREARRHQRPATEGANGSGQSPPTPGATARPPVKQTQVAPPQGTGAELAWALPTAAAPQGWGETSAPLVAGTAEGRLSVLTLLSLNGSAQSALAPVAGAETGSQRELSATVPSSYKEP